jgi:serine/threonine protein kinase
LEFAKAYLASKIKKPKRWITATKLATLHTRKPDYADMARLLRAGRCESLEEVEECSQIQLGRNYHVINKLAVGGFFDIFFSRDFWGNPWVIKSQGGSRSEYFSKILNVTSKDILSRMAANIPHRVRSEYIAQMHLGQIEKGHREGETILIEEYFPYILENIIKEKSKKGKTLAEKDMWTFLYHAASAAHSAHNEGCTHCDIKPNNFGFKPASPGYPNGRYYLFDFGLADFGKPPYLCKAYGILAKPPESWLEKPPTPKVDTYEIGVSAVWAGIGYPPLLSNEFDNSPFNPNNPPFDPGKERDRLLEFCYARIMSDAYHQRLASLVRKRFNPRLAVTLCRAIHPDPSMRPTSRQLVEWAYNGMVLNGRWRT